MRDYAYSDLCTQTLNQLSVGIVFTKNGIIQFMNTQMSVWLNQNVQLSNNLTFSDIFHHQDTLLHALKKSQELLNQTKCCCYTIQKSLFLKKSNSVFRIKSFRVNPEDKFSDVCWIFQDITPVILKRQLIQYERTSMRVFELLRSLHNLKNKKMIFYQLIQIVLNQYRLKTAFFFECKRQELKCIFSVGDYQQFPYAFKSISFKNKNLNKSVVYQSFKYKKTICCKDISQNSFYSDFLKTTQDKKIKISTCAFPVIIQKRAIGVIGLYSYDSDFFSDKIVFQLDQLLKEICLYIEELDVKEKQRNSLKKLQKKLEKQVSVLEKNKIIMQNQMAESNRIVADLILARNQAEVATRSKMNFLANVSHELRTPLNAILGFAQIMSAETFGPISQSQYKEYVSFIQKSAFHLLGLINDILDLSRVESGKMVLNETRINLNQILKEVMDLISQYPNASERNINLNLNQNIILLADERALKQIFLNILSNAIKFTQKGGNINVYMDEKTLNGITLVFEDDGIGIPKDKVSVLFQPFTQIENILTRSHQGSGLGLVLVKKMVILHQGTVCLESEEGKGTKLIVHFPASRIIEKGVSDA